LRITSVKATLLTERVSRAEARVPTPGSVLAVVGTDEGLTGVGLGGGGLTRSLCGGSHLATASGRAEDALCIECHEERMYEATLRHGQAGIALMAISTVGLARWDLKGKALG
jgi:L-alanine-DL-glutamate epimerase-like enolase superfamily enzyme